MGRWWAHSLLFYLKYVLKDVNHLISFQILNVLEMCLYLFGRSFTLNLLLLFIIIYRQTQRFNQSEAGAWAWSQKQLEIKWLCSTVFTTKKHVEHTQWWAHSLLFCLCVYLKKSIHHIISFQILNVLEMRLYLFGRTYMLFLRFFFFIKKLWSKSATLMPIKGTV